MAFHAQPEPYAPPRIEQRDPIDVALIGATAASPVPNSAAFRPTTAYEPPRIESRESIIGQMVDTVVSGLLG